MFWYLEVLKKYAVFAGRARRREYWFFALINGVISILLSLIDSSFGSFDADEGLGALSGIYTIAVLLPGVSVGVRRLHDTGKSGWWMLICLVPIAGAIALLVFLVKDGEPGENEYGPDPKAEVDPGEAPDLP